MWLKLKTFQNISPSNIFVHKILLHLLAAACWNPPLNCRDARPMAALGCCKHVNVSERLCLSRFLDIWYHFHLCRNHGIFSFLLSSSLCTMRQSIWTIWLHVYDTFYYVSSSIVHPSSSPTFPSRLRGSIVSRSTRKCRHVSAPHTTPHRTGSRQRQANRRKKKLRTRRDKKRWKSLKRQGKKEACRNSKTRTLDAGEGKRRKGGWE